VQLTTLNAFFRLPRRPAGVKAAGAWLDTRRGMAVHQEPPLTGVVTNAVGPARARLEGFRSHIRAIEHQPGPTSAVGAKSGANRHRLLATPSDLGRSLSQLNRMSGIIGRCPATAQI